MIISASRRTDIPAFYSRWLMQRLREGFCEVANPFNPKQISKISLRPESVEAIVFWSRFPEPLIQSLPEIINMGYPFYFLFTLNAYPRLYEPFNPKPEKALGSFRRLSDKICPEKVIWRYDPIIITDNMDTDFHKRNFKFLCNELSGATVRVITSYATDYAKTLRNMELSGRSLVRDYPKTEEYSGLLDFMKDCAAARNIELRCCCDNTGSSRLPPAKCIDNELIECISGRPLPFKKDNGQRPECRCHQSRDIGAYDTCLFGCRYCYAVRGRSKALEYFRKHDPSSVKMKNTQ